MLIFGFALHGERTPLFILGLLTQEKSLCLLTLINVKPLNNSPIVCYICNIDINPLKKTVMKLYIITVFDTTSTQEKPIKPVQIVVDSKSLSTSVASHVDETHYVMVGSIDGKIG